MITGPPDTLPEFTLLLPDRPPQTNQERRCDAAMALDTRQCHTADFRLLIYPKKLGQRQDREETNREPMSSMPTDPSVTQALAVHLHDIRIPSLKPQGTRKY
ncbi:hypothetical protein NP233_g11029 [Leucocoprinus birnbaumii]|uniref:Uncharacterized protein n=1 Tax=Leucocoprinus birnbaumii TaxID=56174 RepID=A0AAD5VH67_9AGAR|nr:hypothetical protein NP233_g11029 [Leucocoprinus birnbaumii]